MLIIGKVKNLRKKKKRAGFIFGRSVVGQSKVKVALRINRV